MGKYFERQIDQHFDRRRYQKLQSQIRNQSNPVIGAVTAIRYASAAHYYVSPGVVSPSTAHRTATSTFATYSQLNAPYSAWRPLDWLATWKTISEELSDRLAPTCIRLCSSEQDQMSMTCIM